MPHTRDHIYRVVARWMVFLLVIPSCSGSVSKLETIGEGPAVASASPAPSVSIYPVPSATPPKAPEAAPYVPAVVPSPPPVVPSPPPSPSPGGQTPGLRTYTLAAHGKATAQFTVTKGSPSATFTTTHSGQATMITTLIAPNGDVIAASSPGKVFRSEQPNSDTYLVGRPDPGIWRVDVTVSSAPGLVSVRVAFTRGPKGNAAPLASATAALNERLVTVDAASSTDTDGTIVEYLWDFGDGSIGSGSRSTHGYAGPGTYTINLVVKDNQGGLGFSTLDPVTVLK